MHLRLEDRKCKDIIPYRALGILTAVIIMQVWRPLLRAQGRLCIAAMIIHIHYSFNCPEGIAYQEITKATSSVDILPTLANLFDLDTGVRD